MSPYLLVVVFVSARLLVQFGGLTLMQYMMVDSLACLAMVAFAIAAPQVRFRVHDISYGTYVYHAPLLALFVDRHQVRGARLWLLMLPSVLALATLSWFFVERPALRFKNRLARLTDPKRIPQRADSRAGTG
jgi:peptidoglycan/LPS O-acetylase OafA/YrhL